MNKKSLRFVGLAVLLTALLTIAVAYADQASVTSLEGRVVGVIVIPAEEMAKIPDEAKNQTFGNEEITDLPDGSREVRVGIKGWKVKAGGRSSITSEGGIFTIKNIPVGQVAVSVSFMNQLLIDQVINVVPGKNTANLLVRVDLKKFLEKMKTDDSKLKTMEGPGGGSGQYPCLDNNFFCYSFVGSDCWKNLMRSNPYCWNEATGSPSYVGIWCNGTRNCSVFIGHPQSRHCDWS